MSAFTMIILILFVGMLTFQLVSAIERDRINLAVIYALEIAMFAYLAKNLA